MTASEDQELRARLEALDAASLCDAAAKAGMAVGVVDPSIDLISAGTKLIGRAHPMVCDVDFLEVFKALSEAGEGEALLIEAPAERSLANCSPAKPGVAGWPASSSMASSVTSPR